MTSLLTRFPEVLRMDEIPINGAIQRYAGIRQRNVCHRDHGCELSSGGSHNIM